MNIDDKKIQERVILGLPIITEFGELKPLSIQEFLKREDSVSVISMSKRKLLAELGQMEQKVTGESDKVIWNKLKELEQLPFIQLLQEYFEQIFHHYVIVTRLCKFFYYDDKLDEYDSKEERDKASLEEAYLFLLNLDEEQFDTFRKYLLELHSITDTTAKLNPTLYKREERGRRLFSTPTNAPNLATMASAVAMYGGIDYINIAKWNYLQLSHSFHRIANMIMNRDTTLFSTVSSEVEIHDWAENVSTKPVESNDKTLAQYQKSFGA